MAKYYGTIGFAESYESAPGVWKEQIIEREYYGDTIRNNRSLYFDGNDAINDSVNVSNQISIVADPYTLQNFHSMRYATFMGSKWKVTTIDVQYPRLVLTLGGLYNGH